MQTDEATVHVALMLSWYSTVARVVYATLPS